MPELTADERETRAKYYRKWRAENKDKTREYNRRYWAKKTVQRKEEGNNAEKNNQS